MKKFFIFLFGLAVFTSASAVEYQYMPLVIDGKKWVEYFENYEDYENDLYNQDGVICYQLSGETEINGKTYHNLFATLNSKETSETSIPIAYVREQDRKVFAVINGDNGVDFPQGYNPISLESLEKCQYDASSNEYLIYDFNDITAPYATGSFTGEVETSQAEVNGQMVNIYSVPTNNVIYFTNDKQGFIVQEGVGTLHEVFINPWPIYPTNGLRFNLAWVEVDRSYLYKGAYYDKAMECLLSTDIAVINNIKQASSVRYYNLAGVESAEPQDGVSIKVTTYSDGSRKCEKVLR